MTLGRVHDMYREMFGIRTRNPWWYTTHLLLPVVRDRQRWWRENRAGDSRVHSSPVREYHVFEVVSHRQNIAWPEGARTTRVRYVGPDPQLWMPQPPYELAAQREYR